MKILKSLIIKTICLFSIYAHAQISEKISINPNDLQIYKTEDAFDKVRWKTDYATQEIGNPDLPVYRASYVLPIDAKITEVKIKRKEKKLLKENIFIAPVKQPILTNNNQPLGITYPNIKVYESDDSYPNKLYEIEADEIFMGYHIVTLLIYPFEYKPKSRNLFYYSELDFTINYIFEANNNLIKPLTQTITRAERCKSFISSIVANKADIDRFGSNVQSIWDGTIRKTQKMTSSKQKAKSITILNEIPPDYLIITCDSLKSTFSNLANWKTKKGIFTTIKTVEEIASEYSGFDKQEKIRKYIMESYTHWGSGLYILLGGDVNIIPARMVVGIDNILHAADMYYSSYNGNWNPDGDNLFNAPNNISQISIGSILGRIPIKNNTEASHYINKLIDYENASNMIDTNYLTNYLYSDAYMTPNGATSSTPLYIFDLDSIKSFVSKYVPTSYIQNKYICDNALCNGNTTHYTANPCKGGDIELNRNNFLSCLNSGGNLGIGKFHFVYHMDHSGSQSLGTSSIDKGQAITNTDVDGLTNGGASQILMSGSCHPANFVEDCIAEHYLNKQDGGGVAFIGNTDAGYVSECDQLKQYLKGLFTNSINKIGETYLYVVKQSNSSRNNKPWRLHLLGDPEMPIWTNSPQTLSVKDTSAVLLGEQNINITINNLPTGQSALVCFQKGDEIYLTASISDTTTHTFAIKPETIGDVYLTITAHNFKPYEKVISVNQTSAPHLFVKSVDFLDNISPATGNGNGKNDAGETIQLKATIKNSGVNPSNNVLATLNVNSPKITILNNQASFTPLASGETTVINFQYTIDKYSKEILSNDTLPIRFNLAMVDTNNTIWSDTFNIDVFADSIHQGNKTIVFISNGHSIIEAGDTVRFNIDLKNIGKAPTKGLKAKITANSAYVQSCTSTWHNFPVLNFNDVKKDSVPFEFVSAGNYPVNSLQNLKFILTIQNEYAKEWNYNFDLYKPVKPTGLDFTADSTEIYPIWNYSAERSGFNVYRCNSDSLGNPIGSYVKINTDSVTFRYYLDKNLQKLTRYLYKISALSKTGNEGELSDPLLAWTSLSVKKYHYDFGSIRGGITTADINNDGKREIFATTRAGTNGAHLLGVDCNGQELFNIDGNVTTMGAFEKMNGVSHGTPAISEMASDGTCKIFGTTRDYPPYNLYCFSNKDNDNNGKPDLLGPNNLPANLPNGNITGAILSNMDNSQDGSLESVVVCENGNVALFNSNLNLSGTISQNSASPFYGAIAVADIDKDGDKEIIKSNDAGIYIWTNDGNSFGGANPFFNLSTSYPYPSVVVCDIDNDGNKEIVTAYNNKVYAIRTNTNNSLVANWNQPFVNTSGGLTSNFSIGDLNHDGKLEIVIIGTNTITVVDNFGNILSSLNISNLSPAGPPILADIDGDSDNEIIFGSTSGLNKFIYAYNPDLSKVLGFPLKTDETANCVPSVSDINGDGKNEIILGVGNWIYIWKTNGTANNVEWGSVWQNQYNTSEYTNNCIPLTITKTEIWNSDKNLCGGLTVKSETLTINNNSNITTGNVSTVTVLSGATLIIDSGKISNCNVTVQTGGKLVLKNNGGLDIRSNGEFKVEQGAIFENQYGIIE